MEFLSGKCIYHGDLAARNILLTESLTAKVSDFGLSRRLYNKTYAVLRDEDKDLKLPMKWLALETLQEGKRSVKSDAWSYGVLMWEVFECGTEPYGKGVKLNLTNVTQKVYL